MQHTGTYASFKCITPDKCTYASPLLGCNAKTLKTTDFRVGEPLPTATWPPTVPKLQNFTLQLKETIFILNMYASLNPMLNYRPWCRWKTYSFPNPSS